MSQHSASYLGPIGNLGDETTGGVSIRRIHHHQHGRYHQLLSPVLLNHQQCPYNPSTTRSTPFLSHGSSRKSRSSARFPSSLILLFIQCLTARIRNVSTLTTHHPPTANHFDAGVPLIATGLLAQEAGTTRSHEVIFHPKASRRRRFPLMYVPTVNPRL
jgi:hypothetical protein